MGFLEIAILNRSKNNLVFIAVIATKPSKIVRCAIVHKVDGFKIARICYFQKANTFLKNLGNSFYGKNPRKI